MVRMMMASRAEGFGAEVKRRIMLAPSPLAGYATSITTRPSRSPQIRGDFDSAFQEVDVLLARLRLPGVQAGRADANPWQCICRHLYDHGKPGRHPGISIPATDQGQPAVGLQLLAPPFAEEKRLRTARIFERQTDWHTKRPDWYNGGSLRSSQRLAPTGRLAVAAADRLLMQRALFASGASPRQSRWRVFAGDSSQSTDLYDVETHRINQEHLRSTRLTALGFVPASRRLVIPPQSWSGRIGRRLSTRLLR